MRLHKTGLPRLLLVVSLAAVTLAGCKDASSRVQAANGGASSSGAVDIHKMGGGIDVAQAPNGADLSTMGGDIQLDHVSSFAKVKTMGGNVSIDHADASVDATTMGGNVVIRNANGSIHARTMAGNVTVQMVGSSSARRDIDLSSNSGTITLTVLKDFPMQIHVQLAYTKNAGDHFEIMDSLGLKQEKSQDWDYSHGTPRRYIRASGTVGNGLNQVTIETIDGNVILRQE